MAVSLRESVAKISDPGHLDESVEEVFGTMLGWPCSSAAGPEPDLAPGLEPDSCLNPASYSGSGFETSLGGQEAVTAVVGFGGALSGACIFRVAIAGALKITARLTGAEMAGAEVLAQDMTSPEAASPKVADTAASTEPGGPNATVQDAIGELCNMLAGSWKLRIPELAARCGLSVPAVITGRNYRVRMHAPEFELRRLYCAGNVVFEVTIACDGIR